MNDKTYYINNVSVIGDGGWGTTLAILLAQKDIAVRMWGPFTKYLRQVKKNRYNSKFLPGIRIPNNIKCVEGLKEAVTSCDLIVFAIPSKYACPVLKRIRKTKIDLKQTAVLSVTKGIDNINLKRVSELIYSELGKIPLAVLSGPTIAMEVARGIPSSAVIASEDIRLAKKLQPLFNSSTFRVYTNNDIIGVEIGGCVKNIIAIACGVCDGLGFGTNTKAAILTRGLAEITRFGRALGAKSSTFSGLSGVGDLVTTCFSPRSRNRTVGEQLGKGKSIKQIASSMEMVAEGVDTVKAVHKLCEKLKIEMPITSEVYQIIYKNKTPQKAVADLMSRQLKTENR